MEEEHDTRRWKVKHPDHLQDREGKKNMERGQKNEGGKKETKLHQKDRVDVQQI